MALDMTDNIVSAPSHPEFMGEMTGMDCRMFGPDHGPVIPSLPKGIL